MMKLFFLVSTLGILSSNVMAVPIDAVVTADNHYAIYTGNESGVTYVDRNEMGPAGDPGTYNWSLPESFSFDVSKGDYIYVAGWSDDNVAQGWIGEFNTPTGSILSNTQNWEVLLTGHNLDDNDPAPTEAGLLSEIAGATWNQVTDYRNNGDSPWGTISQISAEADWIWGSALIPGSGNGEYQIFRTQVGAVPEPGSLLLLGMGLLGFLAVRRRFKK